MRFTRGPFQSLTRTCADSLHQELNRNVTRILLTNDDGIHSAGLVALERALRAVGDVYVVAPAAEMSGASHSLTLARPLRIRQIDERHWTVDGTPTDCVTLALHKILQESELPHVCASGINHGGNLGDDATYSGTDRKSTRLNSSHVRISYAVFCLKKKKTKTQINIMLYYRCHPCSLTYHAN